MNEPMARLCRCRWMSFKLEFHEKALREWHSLDAATRARLKKKLEERLNTPHVPAARLRGAANRYKIKLMRPAIRLVYEVVDARLVVKVIAIGERSRSQAYERAKHR